MEIHIHLWSIIEWSPGPVVFSTNEESIISKKKKKRVIMERNEIVELHHKK